MYNYRNNKNSRNNRSGGGAPYVWRVSWWNSNEYGCPMRYKAFSNKQAALSFICKLKCNIYNNVTYASPEKWFGN